MNEFNQLTLNKGLKKSFALLLLFALLSFFVLCFFSDRYSKRTDDNYTARQLQTKLIEKTESLKQLILKIELEAKESNLSFENLMSKKEESGCEFFFIKEDSIKYWTTNLISIEDLKIDSKSIVKLNNGWFKSLASERDNYTIIGLIPIKSEYQYNNEFLPELFNYEFNVNSNYSINLSQREHNVWDKNGEFLFSIQRLGSKKIITEQAYILFILFHVLLLLVLIIFKKLYENFAQYFKRKWIMPLIIVADVIVLWLLINYIRSPHILFDSFLYLPVSFADQFHNSIADYFTNAILFLFVIYMLFTKRILLESLIKETPYLRVTALLILNIIALIFFENSVFSLFKNSQITFQFGQDFITNPGITCLLFLILSMLSFGLFLLVKASVEDIKKMNFSMQKALTIGVVLLIVLALINISFSLYFFYSTILFLLLVVSMWLMKVARLNAIQLVFYLILFSLYMSVLSSVVLQKKEITERQFLAEKLVATHDPLAEFEFNEIEANVYRDEDLNVELKQHLSDSIENVLIKRIENHFSSGSWKKYTAYVTICDSSKILNIQPEDYLINCSDYFDEFIEDFGEREVSESLIHLTSSTLNNAYIARLDFDTNNDSDIDLNIFVELVSEFIPEGVGYTELFTDETFEIQGKDIINYSFAKYENHQLVYKFGAYYYSMDFSKYAGLLDIGADFDYNHFNHLVYQFGDGDKLIISRPQNIFLEKIAPFSYFFILFSVFIIGFAIISNFTFKIFNAPLSFRKRIQFSFTGVILFSFLVIGSVTLFYIVDINNNKNKEILSEKAHSVLVELEHKLSDENALPVEMTEYLNSLLNKFSLVFFSDINLYDLEGRMIASSRPRIINEGLISPLMHPESFRVLNENKSLLFIQSESIGRYNYLSAYLPFRNADNQIIAYLNLPYFARQSEIQKEITTFMVALINIYLLFFVIAIIIALIISRNMSRPLEMIRNRIAHLSLGGANNKISWHREDEIGGLIVEYNRMIDELGKSAELLAKSERESAWREMAKQVAHEIKNPLTPMKLSVQYLKKMWDDKSPEWDEHLERFSKTIIQQIDTLSEIASAFSDFAKMPKKKIETVEIEDIISKSLGLYKEHENLKIHFESQIHGSLVAGDKNQLLRVFNNLIKNSIQALEKKKGGEIYINLSAQNGSCLVFVKDNGIGIPKERAEKIFSPSFTTKTSGMGMGLSMVKSIVIDTGGKIWFESEENVGTTFYIELPLYSGEKL